MDRIELTRVTETEVDIDIYDCGNGQEISYTLSTDSFNKLIKDYQKELKPLWREYATTDSLNRLEERIKALESKSEPKTESVKIGDLCWFYNKGNDGFYKGKISVLDQYDLDMFHPYYDKDGVCWDKCMLLKSYIFHLQSMIKE